MILNSFYDFEIDSSFRGFDSPSKYQALNDGHNFNNYLLSSSQNTNIETSKIEKQNNLIYDIW